MIRFHPRVYTVLELPLDWRPSPELTIEVLPLVPRPADEGAWRDLLLGRELPTGSSWRGGVHAAGRSALGWPMTIDEGEVLSAGGVVLERRVLACYHFLDHLGGALVCARDLARFQRERQRIGQLLAGAYPSFAGASLALAELLPCG